MNRHTPESSLEVERVAHSERGRQRYLFLVSDAASPCGVEAFARQLQSATGKAGIRSAIAATNGGISDTLRLAPALAKADYLIVNLPIVAWKRRIVGSWLALLLARVKGATPALMLHEWTDLDWRRRVVIAAHIPLARKVMMSSPVIAAQFDRSFIGRLWAKFLKAPHGLLPIPPNVRRPDAPTTTSLAEELGRYKAEGNIIVGQFGSIYPKKQSMLVLDIVAELKRRGHQVRAVFIGSFVKATDHIEEDFWVHAKALGVAGDVEVTGYVQSAEDLFAAFDQVDAFVYDFAEGLSARRGSVLACLQSGRPVIVNEPAERGEFDHHPDYRSAITLGMLRFVPLLATTDDFADALVAVLAEPPRDARIDFDGCWNHAVAALADYCPAVAGDLTHLTNPSP